MPSLKTTILAVLAATATAMPAAVRFTPRQLQYHALAKRQQEAAAAAGLADADANVMNFALTLEFLESAFYQQGFAKFSASDFAALGLDEQQIADLQQIGKTEDEHVSLLQSSLAQAGVQPVQPCEYDFGFTTAAAMVQTAATLENIGISAYLGAAPFLSDKAILGIAASIVTIEARHQSSIRIFSKQVAVPQAFDASLSTRAVFSLAAPFIKSCPEGSNLKIDPFPKLIMMDGPGPGGAAAGNSTGPASGSGSGSEGGSSQALSVGSEFRVQAEGGSESTATGCGFTSGSKTFFSEFKEGKCNVPENVAGITYVTLTKETPLTGQLTDDNIVAGPMAVTIT